MHHVTHLPKAVVLAVLYGTHDWTEATKPRHHWNTVATTKLSPPTKLIKQRCMMMGRCGVLNSQLGEREDCVETAVDIAPKRDNMLQQLLTILNTDSSPQPSTPLSDDDTAPSVAPLHLLSVSLSISTALQQLPILDLVFTALTVLVGVRKGIQSYLKARL